MHNGGHHNFSPRSRPSKATILLGSIQGSPAGALLHSEADAMERDKMERQLVGADQYVWFVLQGLKHCTQAFEGPNFQVHLSSLGDPLDMFGSSLLCLRSSLRELCLRLLRAAGMSKWSAWLCFQTFPVLIADLSSAPGNRALPNARNLRGELAPQWPGAYAKGGLGLFDAQSINV